jgi:hypothetical protein
VITEGGPFPVVVPYGTTHSLSLVSHEGLYVGVTFNPKEVTGDEISRRKSSEGSGSLVIWFTHTLSLDYHFRVHDYGTRRPKMMPMSPSSLLTVTDVRDTGHRHIQHGLTSMASKRHGQAAKGKLVLGRTQRLIWSDIGWRPAIPCRTKCGEPMIIRMGISVTTSVKS